MDLLSSGIAALLDLFCLLSLGVLYARPVDNELRPLSDIRNATERANIIDSTVSSTQIAVQLQKIREIQREYRHAIDYGIRDDGYDADVSDDGLLDPQSEDSAADIHHEFQTGDREARGLGSREGDSMPGHGPGISGWRHGTLNADCRDDPDASDSASEGSVSDCGDNEMEAREDWMYSEYLKDIQGEYM